MPKRYGADGLMITISIRWRIRLGLLADPPSVRSRRSALAPT
jgi:hypothetical protein